MGIGQRGNVVAWDLHYPSPPAAQIGSLRGKVKSNVSGRPDFVVLGAPFGGITYLVLLCDRSP
jgi:hypothetical protein